MNSALVSAAQPVDLAEPMISRRVFVITPRREFRDELMPRLRSMLEALPAEHGVQVLGTGGVCAKVQIPAGVDIAGVMPPELVEKCFIELAKQFVLESQP